jgi:hypothetical protein
MTILAFTRDGLGLTGVEPGTIRVQTDDTIAEVTASGYLNGVRKKFNIALRETDLAFVVTKESASAEPEVGIYKVTETSGNWSLVPNGTPGEVTIPTVANHIAVFTNTDGAMADDVATAINGGNLQAGLSGTAGYLASFPSTAAKGSLRLVAVANTGDTLVTIQNAAHGQASVYTIPDGGQAAAVAAAVILLVRL